MKNISVQAAGTIPYYMHDDGQRRFLLIQQSHGEHWSFPKGHREAGETFLACALRETHEETGIDATDAIDPNYAVSDNYQYPSWHGNDETIKKSVIYFPCLLPGQIDVVPQASEVIDYRWCTYGEARELITHPESKEMFERFAKAYLV